MMRTTRIGSLAVVVCVAAACGDASSEWVATWKAASLDCPGHQATMQGFALRLMLGETLGTSEMSRDGCTVWIVDYPISGGRLNQPSGKTECKPATCELDLGSVMVDGTATAANKVTCPGGFPAGAPAVGFSVSGGTGTVDFTAGTLACKWNLTKE